MNKPSKPSRIQTLTRSDLRTAAGGETMLATIAKRIQDSAKTIIQNMR